MEITRTTLKLFREDFKNAVSNLESKYGVIIDMGTISFDENSFSAKITANNGKNETDVEKTQFEQNVSLYKSYGLSKCDYGKIFIADGKKYRLVGFKTKARKNPFVIEDIKKKKFVCSAEFLGLKCKLANLRFD